MTKSPYFWIAVIILVIIVLLIVRRNFNSIVGKFERKNPDYTVDEDGKVIKVTDLDKLRLNKLIEDLYQTVLKPGGADGDIISQAADLTDQELEYVAKEYKKSYGVSLFKDVDNEFMPFDSNDERLLAKLDKLGYKE